MVNTRVGFKKLCVVGEDGQLVANQTHDVDNGVHGLDEVAREVDEQLDGTPDQGQVIGFCLHKDANDLAVFVEPIEECPDLTQASKCLALSLVFLESLRRLVDLFDGRDLVDFGLERQVLELAVKLPPAGFESRTDRIMGRRGERQLLPSWDWEADRGATLRR